MYRTSSGFIPSSSSRSLSIFIWQNPAWHPPIIARVRYLIPVMVWTPSGLWIARTISASVTFSQEHTNEP